MARVEDKERGAAAVEFALVFVLLMGLLFMLVEGGLLFMQQASVSASAREGVRMYAITGDAAEAEEAARDAYPFGSLDEVSPVGACASPPDRSVEVEMVIRTTPTFSLGVFGSPQLRGVGAMRCGG